YVRIKQPFITRPEVSPFIGLSASAIIIVNVLLVVLGREGRSVQTSYRWDCQVAGTVTFNATRAVFGAPADAVSISLFACFRFAPLGKAIRACADNYTGALVVGLNVKRLYALTFGIGAACVGAAGSMLVLLIDVTPALGPALTLLAFIIVITG